MFCVKCGNAIAENDYFCTKCGAFVKTPDIREKDLQAEQPEHEEKQAHKREPELEQIQMQKGEPRQGGRIQRRGKSEHRGIILESAKPFSDGGQNFYWICIAGVVLGTLVSILAGSPVQNGCAWGLFVGLVLWVPGRMFHCGYLKKSYQNMEYDLPYPMDAKRFADVAGQSLVGEDVMVKVKDEETVQIKYRGIVFYFYLSEECFLVHWNVSLLKRYLAGIAWQRVYLGRAVSCISYLVYQIQQELFRESGNFEHYKNVPGTYMKIRKSGASLAFGVLCLGMIAGLAAWQKGIGQKAAGTKEDTKLAATEAIPSVAMVGSGNTDFLGLLGEDEDQYEESDDSYHEYDVSMEDLGGAIVYGTYLYYEESCLCTAVIGFYSDLEEFDYIKLEAMGYGGHQLIDFEGILERSPDGSYRAYSDFFNTTICCIFSEGGLDIIVEDSESSYMETLQGRYEFEEEFEAS